MTVISKFRAKLKIPCPSMHWLIMRGSCTDGRKNHRQPREHTLYGDFPGGNLEVSFEHMSYRTIVLREALRGRVTEENVLCAH